MKKKRRNPYLGSCPCLSMTANVAGCPNKARCEKSQSAALLQDVTVRLDASAAHQQLCCRTLSVRPDASADLLQEVERAFAIG